MNNEKNQNTDTATAVKGGFFAKLDNFWYHYKWHSLIALFLVFTILICTLQMCDKESYDMCVIYAGDHAFARQGEAGDIPEYNKAKNTLSRFISDYDGDGEVNISFRDLFLPGKDMMGELSESEYSRAFNDRSNVSTLMTSSEYFLCFMSAETYESFKDERRFMNIKALFPAITDVEYYDETGMAVKLSSLDFSSLSGFTDLPDDTVICLRSTNFSTHLNKKANKASYERAEETLSKILSYNAG